MSGEVALIEDLLTKYQGMSDSDKAALNAEIDARSKGRLWMPTPGPQLDAVNCLADVLLFGGEGGGGKTDLELGLAFTEHYKSLLIRKQYTDLTGLTDRAKEINGTDKGYNGSSPPRLKTTNGRIIDFAGVDKPGDEDHWQGRPHDLLCVGKGTPVLMCNGSYRPIEILVVGDQVATLEGPRRVTRVFPVQRKRAVQVSVSGFSQIRSLSHELLTNYGWAGHDKSYEFHPCGISESTEYPISYRAARWFSLPYALPFDNLRGLAGRWLHRVSQWLSRHLLGRPCALETSVCREREVLGSDFSMFGGVFRNIRLFFLSIGYSEFSRLYRARCSAQSRVFRFPVLNASIDASSWSSLLDCQDRYSTDFRLCDERPLGSSGLYSLPKHARLRLLRRAGVEQPSPTYCEADDLGQIPTHSCRTTAYIHPYTMDIRQTSEDIVEHAFESTPVGVQDLYDIEVEELNHYITKGGFINRNCIDEAVQLRERAVRFLMGWVRDATDSGQRCRTILGSNPPVDSTGDWIISMFAPWLDSNYARPAKHGELRWVVTLTDDAGNSFDHWVEGPDVKIDSGRSNPDGSTRYLIPKSRTFIPAHLSDNPFLASDGKYAAELDALQEPLRSAIRDGNFMAARVDASDQLIPSDWVWASHNRWTPEIPRGIPMCAIGVDAARKKDETVLAPRYDGYYPVLIAVPGHTTPHGTDVAALVLKHRRNGALPVIDCGEMNGAEAFAHLEENGVECARHVGMDSSTARTASKHLKFFNKRAEVYWKFMEALDPLQDGGSPIALPDDPMLRSDLTAVKWKLTPNGIKITPKDELVALLGRSPDRGDAVVQAWSSGSKAVTDLLQWRADQRGGMIGKRKRPQVNLGPRRRRH